MVVALGFLLGGEFDEVLADRLGNGSLVRTGGFEAVVDIFGSSWVKVQYGLAGGCITLVAALTALLAVSDADPAAGPTTMAAGAAAVAAMLAEAGVAETAAPAVPAASPRDSTSAVAVADVISLLVDDAVSCTETVSLVVTASAIGGTTGDDSSIVTLFVSILG